MSKVDRFWSHEAQNIRCVRESDYDALSAELAALKAGQGEAVAWMYTEKTPEGFEYRPDFSVKRWVLPHEGYEETPLYADPPASAEARLVPVELLMRLTKRVMLRSQEEAHADACDELRALLARQEAKS